MSALLDRCVVTDAQALDTIEEVADEESSVSSQVDRESAGDDVDKHVAVEDSDEEQVRFTVTAEDMEILRLAMMH